MDLCNQIYALLLNMPMTLTAQSAFLNNFENVVNRRVDIREGIKCYPDTLIIKRIEVRTRLMVFTNLQCETDNGCLSVNSLAVIQIIRQAGVLLSKQ